MQELGIPQKGTDEIKSTTTTTTSTNFNAHKGKQGKAIIQ